MNIVAVAATAAITYALTNHNTSNVTTTPPSATYSDAEQSAAKDKVCHTFDTAGERGVAGQGGMVVNGDLNVPIVLIKMNAVLTVQNSLISEPATPSDVVAAANKYVETATALTTAALAKVPIDDLVSLTKTGNAAMVEFADACGLPR